MECFSCVYRNFEEKKRFCYLDGKEREVAGEQAGKEPQNVQELIAQLEQLKSQNKSLPPTVDIVKQGTQYYVLLNEGGRKNGYTYEIKAGGVLGPRTQIGSWTEMARGGIGSLRNGEFNGIFGLPEAEKKVLEGFGLKEKEYAVAAQSAAESGARSLDVAAKLATPDLKTKDATEAATYATKKMRGKALTYGECFRAVVEGFGGAKAWGKFVEKYNKVKGTLRTGAAIDQFQTSWANQHLGIDMKFCVTELQDFLKKEKNREKPALPKFEPEQAPSTPVPEPPLPEVAEVSDEGLVPGEDAIIRKKLKNLSQYVVSDTGESNYHWVDHKRPEWLPKQDITFAEDTLKSPKGENVLRLTVHAEGITEDLSAVSGEWEKVDPRSVDKKATEIIAANVEPILQGILGPGVKFNDVYPNFSVSDPKYVQIGAEIDVNTATLELVMRAPIERNSALYGARNASDRQGRSGFAPWDKGGIKVQPRVENQAVARYLSQQPKVVEVARRKDTLEDLEKAFEISSVDFPTAIETVKDLASIKEFRSGNVLKKGQNYFIGVTAGPSSDFALYQLQPDGKLQKTDVLAGQIDSSFVQQGKLGLGGTAIPFENLNVAQKKEFESKFKTV